MTYIKVILAKTNITGRRKNEKTKIVYTFTLSTTCSVNLCHATNPSIQSGPGKLPLKTFFPSVFLSR